MRSKAASSISATVFQSATPALEQTMSSPPRSARTAVDQPVDLVAAGHVGGVERGAHALRAQLLDERPALGLRRGDVVHGHRRALVGEGLHHAAADAARARGARDERDLARRAHQAGGRRASHAASKPGLGAREHVRRASASRASPRSRAR